MNDRNTLFFETEIMSETQIASLDRLTQALADEMPEVNQIILARMESEVPLIPQLAGHLIAAGGSGFARSLRWQAPSWQWHRIISR